MTTRSRVSEAVKRLEEAHRIGRQIRREQRSLAPHGHPTVEVVAAGMGLNADNYRKLRLFADPDTGYSKQELVELCQRCKKYQRPLGFTIVAKLLKIRNKKERSKLQRQAIEGAWSIADMDVELARLHGRRRWAGRKPKVPHDADEALMQLDSLCLKWRRWYTQIAEESGTGPSEVGLDDLPETVRRPLTKATRVIQQIEDAVAACSRESASSRHPRTRKGRRRRSRARQPFPSG